VLVDLYRQEPGLREEIAEVFLRAVEEALATGGTWAAGPLLGWLGECAIEGPIAAARPVARHFLDIAAAERDPYLPGVSAARWLADAAQP